MVYEWKNQPDYVGDDFTGYTVLYVKTRDSGILDISNYESIKRWLETNKAEYIEPSFNHWACGYFYALMVENELKTVINSIESSLDDYPIFNEHDYYQRINDEIYSYWFNLSLKERVGMLKEAGENIFQSRHNYVPDSLYETIESWVI